MSPNPELILHMGYLPNRCFMIPEKQGQLKDPCHGL